MVDVDGVARRNGLTTLTGSRVQARTVDVATVTCTAVAITRSGSA